MRGKCLCGQVQFEIVGSVLRLYQCHCSLCRRQGGSSSNTAAIVGKEQFHWLAGQEQISCWVKHTGFRSDFCSNCGSPVPNLLRSAAYYWVPAGLLGGEIRAVVAAHLFVGSKASWDVIGSAGTQYETMPEISELMQHLRADSDT
jgi:hypothetical protein